MQRCIIEIYKPLFQIAFISALTIFLFRCGGSEKSIKEIHIEVTGLDGNGISEEKIRQELYALGGIKQVSFNYLEDEVIVSYDTLKLSRNDILTVISRTEDGKHKILDQYEEFPEKKKDPAPITPDQKDIGDDVNYNDNI